MVSVDDRGRPVPAPAHVPTTAEERRRWAQTERRRAEGHRADRMLDPS